MNIVNDAEKSNKGWGTPRSAARPAGTTVMLVPLCGLLCSLIPGAAAKTPLYVVLRMDDVQGA